MPHNQPSPAFGYAHNIYSCTKPSEANRLAYTMVGASVKTKYRACFPFHEKKKVKKENMKKKYICSAERRKGRWGRENDESEIKDSFAAQKIWVFPLPFPDLQLSLSLWRAAVQEPDCMTK